MKRTVLPLWLAIALCGACEGDGPPATTVLFEVPGTAAQGLYTLPFPNDLRRRDDGTIDLAGLADGEALLIQRYLDIVASGELGGFSTNGAVFFRFSGPIDTAGLPATAAATVEPGAALFLVNIDEQSPRYGERVPVRTKFEAEEARYIGAHHLAMMPVFGFVLDPATTYAAVLTEALRDDTGNPVRAAADFRPLLGDAAPDARLERAHAVYAPLRAFLAQESITGVVGASVFTTGTPTQLAARVRPVIHARPAPAATDLVVAAQNDDYYEVRGSYVAPNFQSGDPPYLSPPAGVIERTVGGEPIVAREETMRFALTVPKGTMPAAGWPIVLYAHGTGGGYRTFIQNGVARRLARVVDGEDATVAQFAVVGIDQVLHGPRAPEWTAVEAAFFNIDNPAAGVANVLQGGIDNYSLLRMVKALSFASLPLSDGTGNVDFGTTVAFDSSKVFFMGHSQGGLTGPSFLAFEPEVKGAVLSGAGANSVLSLLWKSKPTQLSTLFELAMREDVDEFHPVINLIQHMLEPADPGNYAPLFYRRPAAGVGPKHIFISEGLVDGYTPNQTTEALAVATGAPQLGTVHQEVLGLALRGIAAGGLPVAGNVTAEGGTVTAGLLQYKTSKEGHFVVFEDATARRQYSMFLATMARDGVPTIVE